jgi:hypothetical protein
VEGRECGVAFGGIDVASMASIMSAPTVGQCRYRVALLALARRATASMVKPGRPSHNADRSLDPNEGTKVPSAPGRSADAAAASGGELGRDN